MNVTPWKGELVGRVGRRPRPPDMPAARTLARVDDASARREPRQFTVNVTGKLLWALLVLVVVAKWKMNLRMVREKLAVAKLKEVEVSGASPATTASTAGTGRGA